MFSRIANLFKGFLGLLISGLDRRNQEALLQVEKENLRTQIAKYNEGLSHHAALCEKLMSQVKRQEQEERELRAKTTAHLKAGNKEAAGQYALQYENLKRDLEDNRNQLSEAEKTYKELVKARDVSVKAARDKIEALKSGLNDLKVKKAMAELTEMASGMVTEIGGSGDTLNRLTEMVEEERDKASGRVRVAQDSLDMHDVNIKEAEQKALADQALAAFAAAEGLEIAGGEGASGGSSSGGAGEPASKSMGPVTEVPE